MGLSVLPRFEWLLPFPCLESFQILSLQIFSQILGDTGFDYITCAPPPPSCCGFFFVYLDIEYIFDGFWSFLLLVSQQLVVILLSSWKEVSSRSSTPPPCCSGPHSFFFSLRFLIMPPGKSEADWMTETSGFCLTVQFQGSRGSLCSSSLGSAVHCTQQQQWCWTLGSFQGQYTMDDLRYLDSNGQI